MPDAGFKVSVYGEAHEMGAGVFHDTVTNKDRPLPDDDGVMRLVDSDRALRRHGDAGDERGHSVAGARPPPRPGVENHRQRRERSAHLGRKCDA
jgi:hypothetical protein